MHSGPGMAVAPARRDARGSLTSVFVVFIFLVAAAARAQGPNDFQFGPELTTEHGLPQSTVTAILPAESGYLWLGTFGGLVRFDGRTALVFSGTNTPGLTSNRILAIVEGPAGGGGGVDRDLWVGTEHGGLFRLTLAGEEATVAEHLLPDSTVFALLRDERGTLWIGTSSGLVRYADGRVVTSAEDPRLPAHPVFSLGRDTGGRIWVGLDRGVTVIDGRGARPQPGLAGCSVTAIQDDRRGGAWLATDCGLHRATASAPSFRVSPQTVWALAHGADGTLWAGTRSGTFMAFDAEGRLQRSIDGNGRALRALAVDSEGTVWFGTDGDGAGRLRRPFITSVPLPGSPGAAVLPILEDPHGAIWIGARCEGLFRLSQGRTERITTAGGDPCVLSLALDRAGRLWVGGYGGAYRIEDVRAPAGRIRTTKITAPTVYAIHESGAGELFVGTEQGLFEWRDGSLRPHALPGTLAGRHVRLLTESADGSLWVGTTGGLARRQGTTWSHWTPTDGLTHPYVRDVVHEGTRTWIATYGGGINLLEAGRLSTCTSKRGLPDDALTRIIDDDAFLWVTGNRGVFRVSKANLAACARDGVELSGVVPFTRHDGLPSTESNGGAQPAGWRARDGRLWIPTVSGVGIIDPSLVPTEVPRVTIQRVTAEGKDATGEAVVLDAGTSRLDIRYAALTLSAPNRVRFRHMLEGYDNTWIHAGEELSARYTSLPPGTYRFRLGISTGDGEWHDLDLSRTIMQRAHWYQTPWLAAVGLVGMLLAGYGINRVRVARLEQRTRELETHVADRTAELRTKGEALRVLNDRLASSNENLQTVIDRLAVGALMLDADGQVLFMNRAARQLLHRDEEGYAGRSWHELLPLRADERRQVEAAAALPPAQRSRLSFLAMPAVDRHFSMEMDVQDDPRNASQKILFLYDVSELFDLRRLREENLGRHGLVGESAAMRVLFKQIEDVSATDATVLIEGETGAGKELVARAIHAASARRARSFVAVNCAGLTESLLASQLFGHRRGAFTGAIADQVGLFEAANGGTLFLDEIGDIPMSVQTTLLRVLQEREILRVGESSPRRIDARILAATHRNLDAEVAAGRLRQDLLYRIRVVRVRVPPLRERPDDIPLLVGRFLSELRQGRGDHATDGVSRDAMATLMAYGWPGNVRELRSAIESASLGSRSSVIQREDLPPEIRYGAPPPSLGDARAPAPETLAAAEIRDALARTGGNRAAAARILGIGRTTLYRRLKELGDDLDVTSG